MRISKIIGGSGLAIASALVLMAALVQGAATSVPGVDPDEALSRLMAGNQRFVAERLTHPNQTAECRTRVAKGQHPFAIILGCSDSRVPPEVIFDQGLGDLFTVRVAGNIAEPATIGSMEYAAEHLGAKLIMVLGHSKCGAVEAALQGGEQPGHIGYLVAAIKPAVERAKNMPGDPLDNAVRANVQLVVEQLKSSDPILSHLVKDGKIKIVGARYDLESGKVEMIQ